MRIAPQTLHHTPSHAGHTCSGKLARNTAILSVSLLVSTCHQPGCPSMPGAYVPCNTTSGQRQNLSPHIEWWRADACAPPTPSKAHGSAVCAAPHNKASPASPARLNDGHCVCADSHAPLAGKKQRTGNQHPKGGVPSGGRSTLHMLPAQPTCATANRLPYQK